MKVETVQQYKVLKYLDKNFDLRYVQLDLVSRNSIQLRDCNNDTAIFTLDDKTEEIKINYDDEYINF